MSLIPRLDFSFRLPNLRLTFQATPLLVPRAANCKLFLELTKYTRQTVKRTHVKFAIIVRRIKTSVSPYSARGKALAHYNSQNSMQSSNEDLCD